PLPRPTLFPYTTLFRSAAIDPSEFIRAVQPLLERQDLNGLLSLLHSRWNCDQLRTLLHSDHLDAKKVALLAVGLVGTLWSVPERSEEHTSELQSLRHLV